MNLEERIKRETKMKYVITSAQCGASINSRFYDGLKSYCVNNNAELIIIPMRGSYKEDDMIHYKFYDDNFAKIITKDTKEYKLNNKIRLMNYDVTPQQIIPITGIERFARDDCTTILPATKIFQKVIPNSNNDLPKILLTTGAVTNGNYRDNRIGRIAEIDHSFGALYVETFGKNKYQFRHLNASNNGVFCDLGRRYDGNKINKENPIAFVLGDYHCVHVDKKVKAESIYMIMQYKPKYVVIHDLFSADSMSHHDKGKIVDLAIKNKSLSLEKELSHCYKELKELCDIRVGNYKPNVIIVKSNHDEHLERYIQEGRFVFEPQNTEIGAKILLSMIKGYDALSSGLSLIGRLPINVKFLSRQDDFKVYGWQLGNHGDLGAKGARGSPRSIEQANGKSITGHSHSPLAYRNVWKVGTSTKLFLGYNRGYNDWLNTHAMLYKNGQPQLINIIDGKHHF